VRPPFIFFLFNHPLEGTELRVLSTLPFSLAPFDADPFRVWIDDDLPYFVLIFTPAFQLKGPPLLRMHAPRYRRSFFHLERPSLFDAPNRKPPSGNDSSFRGMFFSGLVGGQTSSPVEILMEFSFSMRPLLSVFPF